jgi:hypothetical protein
VVQNLDWENYNPNRAAGKEKNRQTAVFFLPNDVD